MNTPARIRRRSTTAIMLIAALATVLPSKEASAQAREMSLEELTNTSTAVVLGRAEAPRSFWNDKRTQIVTEVRIQVDESVKGDVDAETVVTIPGGRVGNTIYEVSDMPVFVDGEQVLVFLWEHPSGKQLVTAGSQGKLEVIERTSGSGRLLRGVAPLLKQAEPLAKTAAADELINSGTGDMPLDDILAQIRTYANE